jgi:hypothetical protein
MAKVAKRVMNMMILLLRRVKLRGRIGILEVIRDIPCKEIPPLSMDMKMQRQIYPLLHHPPATRVTVAANEIAVVMSDWRGAYDDRREIVPLVSLYSGRRESVLNALPLRTNRKTVAMAAVNEKCTMKGKYFQNMMLRMPSVI